jgi:hypothetical protein
MDDALQYEISSSLADCIYELIDGHVVNPAEIHIQALEQVWIGIMGANAVYPHPSPGTGVDWGYGGKCCLSTSKPWNRCGLGLWGEMLFIHIQALKQAVDFGFVGNGLSTLLGGKNTCVKMDWYRKLLCRDRGWG